MNRGEVGEALARVTRALPAGEDRPGQVDMAEAVARAIVDKRHLIVQAGTGTGKCLHPSTVLTLADGSEAMIADLVGSSPTVLAPDSGLHIVPRPASNVFLSGRKAVFRVHTALGHAVTASEEHPLLTIGGWKRLRDLEPADRIATSRRIRVEGTEPMSAEEVRFLAHMVAEGSCQTASPDAPLVFTNFDPAVVDDWKSAVSGLANALPTDLARAGHYGMRRVTSIGHQRNGGVVVLEDHGVLGVLAKRKTIPPAVFRLPNSLLALFLGRLYSGDGCVESPRSVVSYATASRPLAAQLQRVLLRFGVVSSLRRKDALFKGRRYPAWEVDVRGADPVRRFGSTIGPYLVGAKAEELARLIARLPPWNPNVDVLPSATWEIVDRARTEAGLSWGAIRRGAGVASDRTRGITLRALRAIAELCDDESLTRLADSDLYWDRVLGVEAIGEVDTYDVTMAGGEPSFLANGMVVHNSLAYLVPALLSGRKVVVATATKALQDQLAGKDLPFVAEHLGRPVHFAVLKGRSNYLCRQRAKEVAGGDDQLELDDLGDEVGALGRQLLRLVEWGRTSETGDRAELDFEPRQQAWSGVSVTGMECPGANKCPSGEECFAELARDRAEAADVVVVNTHLYGAHLASGGHVLPEHDVVVFDEAHELEDVAAASLGLELGAGRFRALARNVRSLITERQVGDQVDDAGLVLERAVAPWFGKRLPAELPDDLVTALTLAGERVRRVTTAVREGKGDPARVARALQAGGHLAGDIAFVAAATDTDVVWVEGQAHAPVLRIAPVDVGRVLAEKLWGDVTAVLTSATIPTNLAARVGIDDDACDTLDVGSPFDYENNTLLYCAAHLPDPRTPDYEAAMHAELEALLRASEGRTLALFTSWRAMNAAADALRDKLPWPVLTQSDLPKPALVAAFSTDEHASLFATMGFWQGVDVPGPSLSQVVIDKLPFARPDDPLLDARRERAGSTAFRVIDLPRAATLLAQGAGRLIRTATDRGVVAVLDPRLAKAGYRWDLVRALPPMRRTKDRADVESFLANLRSSHG